MKQFIITLILSLIITNTASAQHAFGPISPPGGLGRLDAGAVVSPFISPSAPNTYEFLTPADVVRQPVDPASVINVEKSDVFGKIMVNDDNNVQIDNK